MIHRNVWKTLPGSRSISCAGRAVRAESAQCTEHSLHPRMNMTVPQLVQLLLCVLACGAVASSVYRREQDGSITPIGSNGTSTAETPATHGNDTAKVTRFSSIREYMPTIKSVFIFVCGFSSLLIICLIVKIFRSGKRIRKTRKYDIITTPAERVEMAPLNEDNFEDEDSTVFDVKYRYR